jgi:uncharacterized protein (DUF433 family)
VNPEILGGAPVFVGTRVPAQALLDYLEGGEKIEEFLDDHPTVSRDQVVAFVEEAGTRVVGEHRVKRVLFDENMPRKLRRHLSQFTVRTVQEEGWPVSKIAAATRGSNVRRVCDG